MSELDAGEKALARLYMAGCFHQWGALPGEPAEPPGQSSLKSIRAAKRFSVSTARI